ncbi:hypothetical protein BDW74DRAFT_178838 [Aspergillus multicolor]|uniref:uncharacterized protein n=1 Tax=Aspergillus multicolor TaxID=41759 RepID=UPI003CCDEF00
MEALSPEQRQALLEGPALAPPPGLVSNFEDPPNLTSTGHAILFSIWSVATVCFLIRLYAKAFVARKWQLSDFVIILAWALCMGYAAVLLLAAKYSGVDQWNIRLKNLIELLYYEQIALLLYGICTFFIKLSILIQLLELFAHRHRDWFFWCCHGFIWVNFVYHFISLFVTIFRCRPVSAGWVRNITDGGMIASGNCIDNFRIILSTSSLNALSDIIIFVLPQARIWNLHMRLSRKIALSAVFSVGLIACASGVIKLIYSALMYYNDNKSYYVFFVAVWTLPEMAGGVIAGCLPSVPKVVQNILKSPVFAKWSSSIRKVVSSYSSSQGQTQSSHIHFASPGSSGVVQQPVRPRLMRNSYMGRDHFRLTTFASQPGTVNSRSSAESPRTLEADADGFIEMRTVHIPSPHLSGIVPDPQETSLV